METTVICNSPVIVLQKISSFADELETRTGVKQAVEIIGRLREKTEAIDLLMDFSTLDERSGYKISAHKIWALGFKENEEMQRAIRRIALVANDSPRFRAEQECMETPKHKFFTVFQEALDWLKGTSGHVSPPESGELV